MPNMRVDILPEYVVEQYRALYPEYTPSEVFFAATTAARSWRGAIEEAEARARQAGAPTWTYQLDFRSPLEPQMRAPHTLDIALVFGNLDAAGSITGTGPESQAVSQQMSRAFIALATDGNPNHAGLPQWQPSARPLTAPVRHPAIPQSSPSGPSGLQSPSAPRTQISSARARARSRPPWTTSRVSAAAR